MNDLTYHNPEDYVETGNAKRDLSDYKGDEKEKEDTAIDEKIDYYLRGKTKAELAMNESALKERQKQILRHIWHTIKEGLVYVKLNDQQKALADFKMAITIDPDHEEALKEIIRIETHVEEESFDETQSIDKQEEGSESKQGEEATEK